MNNPVLKKHIVNFINCVCETDYAKANKHLESAIQEKIKDKIRQSLKESK